MGREEGGEGDSGIPSMLPGNDNVWWQRAVQDIKLLGYADAMFCLQMSWLFRAAETSSRGGPTGAGALEE